LFGRSVSKLAIATGTVAPLLLLYAIAREGGSVFKVLDVGAYLTLACSLALLAFAFGFRRANVLAPALALAVVAAFLIPAAAQDNVDSPVFAAYAADRTSLVAPAKAHPSTSGTSTSQDAIAVATTVPTSEPATTVTTSGATTTTLRTTTTRAVVAASSGACPSKGPVTQVDSFAFEQTEPGGASYYVDVAGTLTNNTGAAIDVTSVDFVVLRGTTVVGSGTVASGRTIGSGQRMQWWEQGQVFQSPGGDPTSAEVSAVHYAWNDSRQSGCALL
jgi:hypothetical protein